MLPARYTLTRQRRRITLLRRYGVVVRGRDVLLFALVPPAITLMAGLIFHDGASWWHWALAAVLGLSVDGGFLLLCFGPMILFHRRYGASLSTVQVRVHARQKRRELVLSCEADERTFKLPRLGPRARHSGLAERAGT